MSPIRVQFKNTNGVIRVDVRKLDGTLLARHLPAADADVWLPFSVESPTPALLVISIEDHYGRLLSVHSVGVELLPEGENRLEPEGNPAIEFSAPREGMPVEANSVRVYAFVQEETRVHNVRLVTRSGRVLITQDVYPVDGVLQAELSVHVEEPTFVRVIVSRSAGGAIVDLSSVEIELIP